MRQSMISIDLAGLTCVREARAGILCGSASCLSPPGIAPT